MPFPASRAARAHRTGLAPRARRLGVAVLVTGAALTAAVAGAAPANATWSVVGTDPATGQVGAAVASCTDVRDLTATMALVPGRAAAVSIGRPDTTPLMLAASLRGGATPATATASVTATSGSGAGTQVGVAVVGNGARSASEGLTRAGARVGAGGAASIQGNGLASTAVLDATRRGFDGTPGPLAARLVAALRAGSDAGGDRGCAQPRAAAVVVLSTQSALFVPSATPGPETDASDLVSSGLSPQQMADELAARSVRPAPRGVHAPLVHVSTVAPAGTDALATIEARYAAISTAATRAVPQGEVIDPDYAQGLTAAALILFGALGLSIAVLIIIGLRRADRNAAAAGDRDGDGPDRPKPFRGEVTGLFDLDLAAALRRSRENERRRQMQRAKDDPNGRERAWSGSSTW